MPVWSLQLSCWSRSYPFLHGVTKICRFVQLAALSWLVEVWPDLHNPRCCQGFSICSWKTWMKRFGKDGRMCLSMPVYQTHRINELQCVFSQGALILFYSCTTTSLCVCLCVHQATKTWRWDRCYSQWALCAGLAAGFSPWLNVESKHLPWQKKKKMRMAVNGKTQHVGWHWHRSHDLREYSIRQMRGVQYVSVCSHINTCLPNHPPPHPPHTHT